MRVHDVVIAGGGPAGLMLAGELALGGAGVVVAERRDSQELPGSRAGGLQSRAIEILDQRGIAGRFLAEGKTAPGTTFGWIPLGTSDLPTRHPYRLALSQNHVERLLAGWVSELKVPVRYGCEVTGFAQDDTGVTIEIAGGEPLRARYLVGCDGGRSLIRKAVGVGFGGEEPETRLLLAEAEMDAEPDLGLHRDEKGIRALSVMEDGIRVRVMVPDQRDDDSGEPSLSDLRAAVTAAYGTDFGLRGATSITRFSDAARQAESYRDRRVLLAGDAAHVHYPIGGQGLSLGLQDAVNLGWKLARVVRGPSPDRLLGTYHAEQHPVAARVLRNTLAQSALTRVGARTDALRDTLSELLTMDEPRRTIAAMISGLDIRHDLGEGHPLIGRRMPDLDLGTVNPGTANPGTVNPGTANPGAAGGSLRVYALLRDARPVLLNLGAPGGANADVTGWADRVTLADATCAGPWELPVLGEVPAPAAVLIRPDGHVAWAGDPGDPALPAALTTWFGPPADV